MIIQCEQCQTRFRLDDAKVTDKGVKVRCAKCKHVFSVKREQTETEAQADFGALLDQSVSLGNEEAPSAQQESHASEPQPGAAFDNSEFIVEDFFGQSGRTNVDEFEATREGLAPAEAGHNFSSLSGDPGLALEHDETHAASGEMNFAGFDFGDSATIRPPAAAPAVEEDDSDALESDDEPMFGDAGAAPEV